MKVEGGGAKVDSDDMIEVYHVYTYACLNT